jgi:uncharacterized membrane protein YeaQ/YmgE (transglycosylase-associated protein family)
MFMSSSLSGMYLVNAQAADSVQIQPRGCSRCAIPRLEETKNVHPSCFLRARRSPPMSIIWTIIIGFVAGLIAKLVHPGPNEPSGFILTTLLGIAGAFVATYLGQALGWYRAGEGAGLVGAIIGALIVLFVWGMFAPRPSRA